jgi:parvulin-like peptidyl-prolyl isomerase
MGYAKDNIIARVLLSQEAQEQIDRPNEKEIDARLEGLKEEYGGEEQFYFQLGIAPGEEDHIRDEIAGSLRVDTLIAKVAGGLPTADDSTLESYYAEHADEFMSAEEVRSLHIFKSLQKAENRDDLFKEMREMRTKALAGEDFMELVRAHSDKPEEEADLGWYKRGELMEEFELITFSMELDEISPVFASQWGMHLAKLTDRKPPQPIPISEVTDEIRERLAAEHRDAKLKVFVEALREKATIEDISAAEDE